MALELICRLNYALGLSCWFCFVQSRFVLVSVGLECLFSLTYQHLKALALIFTVDLAEWVKALTSSPKTSVINRAIDQSVIEVKESVLS